MTLRLVLFLLCVFPLAASATEVREVVSPSGIKAWLVEEHGLPLLAVRVAFTGSGTAYDPKGQEGRTGMAAAMLMEGAGELDWRAFSEALENDAIELNFGADEDNFRASVESLSEHKAKAFSYLGMALSKPRFDEAALERVRRQTLSILTQQEKQPPYLLHRGWQQLAFPGHPYGRPVIGTRESIEGMKRAQLAEFTRRYLTQGNMLIAVVGDITPAELSLLLDTHLSGLPKRYEPDSTVADMQLPDKAGEVVIESNIPQTLVMFGGQGLKRNDPDYYTAHMMNHIIGGGGTLSSRLGQEIREKRGLAYSVYSALDPMQHTGLWRGNFSTRNEQAEQALATLRETLKDFSQNGPSPKDLEDARQFVTGSFVLSLDSNAEIANFLISMQMYNLGRDYLDKRNALMEAVKMDDIKKMAHRLLDPAKLLVVMVGKPKLKESKAP